jgi:tRNA A-37 threonylcarbamoyl transferase component Bud32
MKTCPTCQGSYPNNFAICPQDGTPLQDTGTWSEGSVIRGKYRLVTKVGQGGMGAVYKALHLAFDELRALKVIAPELLSDELFVKRFKHEAVITRKLQHPNAVRVDDIDEAEDGRPFIVMEFIEGKSLKKLIREEGPLPVQRVCAIIKQAAAALDAAHRLGMIHRDIKPDNIALVDAPDGETVKVLDFGIAKVKEARMGESAGMTLTGTGVVIGTPQYMSPEQAMGKRGDELDGRADLYSLGIVMYQMLTADLPFKADTTMEMLLAHMQKPPAPISVVHPELQVPEPVATLTMRLLEKNRDMRPASARVLIQEIEKAEKEMANVGATRVVAADEVMRAGGGRAAVGGDQAAAGGAIPPRPQPPQPRPVEPAKVAPRPQQPPLPHPVPRPKPPESHWGMWVAVIVLIVGLGGGGLYIATRPAAPQPPKVTETPTNQQPVEPPHKPPETSTPVSHETTPSEQLTTQPANPNTTEHTEPAAVVPARSTARGNTRKPMRVEEVTPPKPVQPAVDPTRVRSAITQGDFFFHRGEYDSAISAYQDGLNLDPSNSDLRVKLDRAKKAKEIEKKVLQ